MGYWDFAVQMPDKPGELGKLTTKLGEAGINIEGAITFAVGGQGWVHLCVSDTHRKETGKVIETTGHAIGNLDGPGFPSSRFQPMPPRRVVWHYIV